MPMIPTGQGAQIVINGTLVDIDGGSVNLSRAIGQRDTLTLVVNDPTNAYHFAQGNSVMLYDSTGVAVFGGIVTTSQENRVPYGGTVIMRHTLTCADNHYHADKLQAVKSYTTQTAAYIVNDLITSYLSTEGITAGTISTGVTLPSAVYNVVPVAQVLDDLAGRCGFYWLIDANKVLTFASYGTTSVPASFGTFDGSQAVTATTQVTRGNQEYRNTQYALGGVATTGTLTETHKGDGTTRTWAVAYIPNAAPTITVNGTGQTVGALGSSGYQWYYDPANPVISQDAGQTVLTSSDTLVMSYVGEYAVTVVTQDDAQILAQQVTEGGAGNSSGVVAGVTQAAQNASPNNTGTAALAALKRFSQSCYTVEFTTKQSGLAPGQLLTVNLTDHAISNATAIIEQITVTEPDGFDLWYDVIAVVGPTNTSWVQFFQALIPTTSDNTVLLGTQAVLQYFKPVAVGVSLSVTLTPNVYACPVPNTTLYPSTSLYPC